MHIHIYHVIYNIKNSKPIFASLNISRFKFAKFAQIQFSPIARILHFSVPRRNLINYRGENRFNSIRQLIHYRVTLLVEFRHSTLDATNFSSISGGIKNDETSNSRSLGRISELNCIRQIILTSKFSSG